MTVKLFLCFHVESINAVHDAIHGGCEDPKKNSASHFSWPILASAHHVLGCTKLPAMFGSASTNRHLARCEVWVLWGADHEDRVDGDAGLVSSGFEQGASKRRRYSVRR